MLPPLESMEMGRVNQKDFEIFALHFVPGVIKAQAWKDCSKKQKFSNIVNESDEAIAFLILANNWDVWMDQCSNQSGGTTVKVRDTSSKQKYMEKDGGRGYSFNSAGRKYFNDRYDFAMNDRDAHGEDFDNYLFQLLNKKINHESSNCKKNKFKESEPEIECRNNRNGKARKVLVETQTNLHSMPSGNAMVVPDGNIPPTCV
jgi:hypothetical protein